MSLVMFLELLKRRKLNKFTTNSAAKKREWTGETKREGENERARNKTVGDK